MLIDSTKFLFWQSFEEFLELVKPSLISLVVVFHVRLAPCQPLGHIRILVQIDAVKNLKRKEIFAQMNKIGREKN
jgi:hypothetical protein